MPADQRRCRRCKRKRLEDEPTEVMQYKTCAKCRIIERNKKNSRRPLADETMLYGLKQFQEQRASDNFMEEEGLLDDEFFRRFQNKVFNYDAEIREVLSNPNYVPPVLALGSRYTFKQDPGIKKTYQKKKKFEDERISQFQAAATPTTTAPAEEYGILTELSKLGNTGEETHETDGVDPYAYKNVYSDFQAFLTAVLGKRERGENVHNLVYLREFENEVVEILNNDPTNTVNEGERQIKINLHHNIKSLYIDPISALTKVEYNQVHTNVQDAKNNVTIRGYHSLVQQQGATTVSNAIKNSSIYFTYDRAYNVLIIKVNHHTFKPSTNSYSPEIKQKIHELVRPVGEYNVYTAGLVYDKLLQWGLTMDPKTQLFIGGLTREDFVSDFLNFDLVFTLDVEEAVEQDEIVEEEEEEEEDEDSDDEQDDSVLGFEATPEVERQGSAEALDPVLKPGQ